MITSLCHTPTPRASGPRSLSLRLATSSPRPLVPLLSPLVSMSEASPPHSVYSGRCAAVPTAASATFSHTSRFLRCRKSPTAFLTCHLPLRFPEWRVIASLRPPRLLLQLHSQPAPSLLTRPAPIALPQVSHGLPNLSACSQACSAPLSPRVCGPHSSSLRLTKSSNLSFLFPQLPRSSHV